MAIIAPIVAIALGAYSATELRRFARAEIRRTTVIYTSGQSLAPAVDVRLLDLAGTLARLGYTETRTAPTKPGEFRRTASSWHLVLLGQDGADVPRGAHVRMALQGDRIARVTRDGRDVPAVTLEGHVLTGDGDRTAQDYRPVRLADTPRAVIDAVLAAEDHRFFEHGALDARGLMRAAWTNLRTGRVIQGGSTLTQQLVKSRLLTPRRTMWRKMREAWLALLVECRYSKVQILEAYLNEVYLGQRWATGHPRCRGRRPRILRQGGPPAHHGRGCAPGRDGPRSQHAFSRPQSGPGARATRCRPGQDARAPHAGRRRVRRGARRAAPGPGRTASGLTASYFTDYVRQEVQERFKGPALRALEGARIFTTLDATLQRFAESAVTRGLERLERGAPGLRRADAGARLQAALVALDPATGEIRALVGGRDYRTSQFNRAIMARRQPGSAFKPFVYAAALHPRAGRPLFTAASIVDDSPVTVATAAGSWTPRNYEDRYEKRVTIRRALEQSLNSATVRVAQAVGPAAVVETAQRFGFGENLAAVPAVSLGAFEMTPLELARAAAVFANAGVLPAGTTALRAAYRRDGSRVPAHEREVAVRVMPAAEAYVMTSLLQGVVRSGTAAVPAALGIAGEVAGKTGTTNEGRDAWFVGYSSRLVAVVWVGFDDGQPHALSGARAALPIWADFMRQALAARPAPPFTAPEGIAFADVDVSTGKRANPYCPLVAREVFVAGTEPAPCHEHAAPPRLLGGLVAALTQLAFGLILAAVVTGCATSRDAGTVPAPVPPPTSGDRPRPDQTGYASWYGKAHHGRRTTSGEIYDMNQRTAAHPALPMGTRLLVTNLSNGRTVTVRVNDRGPTVDGRILDLSYAAARELGAVGDGVVPVRIRVLREPPPP